MAKKRKNLQKKGRKYHSRSKRSFIREAPKDTLTQPLLAMVAGSQVPLAISTIIDSLSSKTSSAKDINNTITNLVRQGDLRLSGKKHICLDTRGSLMTGVLEKNPRGFGFATRLAPAEAARFYTKDPFLSRAKIGGANHGDRILLRVLRVRSDGRPEASLVAVIERNSEQINGFYREGTPSWVEPEDLRYPDRIYLITPPQEMVHDGDAVIMQIVPGTAGGNTLQGKITEVLGDPKNVDVQMQLVISANNLPHLFSDSAMAEAERLSMNKGDLADRLDLRNTCHITIDGETAKDFDDAIAVEKKGDIYTLYVSIADVSHFVRPGTELDKEAYQRGTSIYFPGRVIPMLPEQLSNHLCSLVPNEDRLTMTAVLEIDSKGTIREKSYHKSVICSKQRFTYTTVNELVNLNIPETRSTYEQFTTMLDWAKELATILHQKRMKRGSLGFNIPEPEILLEENGSIRTIRRAKRNFAHQIIEEFMLAANEAVAETFTKEKRTFIYRIHEVPDSEKVAEFAEFAKSLGFTLAPPGEDPGWFAEILSKAQGTPAEYVVNNLLLRTMQQAKYSTINHGHFGLAATDYTHFTSPIRRYPDLMVHRFLSSLILGRKETKKGATPLEEQACHLSSRERVAITAERDISERLKLFFMEQFIGQSFAGVISGVSDNAIYIELVDLFVSGVIELGRMKDDYYLFDAKRYRVIGEITGRIFQLGEPLTVTLEEISHSRKKIHFLPVNEK